MRKHSPKSPGCKFGLQVGFFGGWKAYFHLENIDCCAVSSVVEHYLDTVGVGGSKPPPRTIPPHGDDSTSSDHGFTQEPRAFLQSRTNELRFQSRRFSDTLKPPVEITFHWWFQCITKSSALKSQ